MPCLSKRRLLFRTFVALVILTATLCGRVLYGLHADNQAINRPYGSCTNFPTSTLVITVQRK